MKPPAVVGEDYDPLHLHLVPALRIMKKECSEHSTLFFLTIRFRHADRISVLSLEIINHWSDNLTKYSSCHFTLPAGEVKKSACCFSIREMDNTAQGTDLQYFLSISQLISFYRFICYLKATCLPSHSYLPSLWNFFAINKTPCVCYASRSFWFQTLSRFHFDGPSKNDISYYSIASKWTNTGYHFWLCHPFVSFTELNTCTQAYKCTHICVFRFGSEDGYLHTYRHTYTNKRLVKMTMAFSLN